MQLFEPANIGSLRLKNRFLRSGTWDGMADEQGNPTEPMVALYKKLVAGGVGLVQTGVAHIDKNSVTFPGQLGLYDDDQVPAFETLTRAVHEAGGLIGIQLVHGGSMRFVDIGTTFDRPFRSRATGQQARPQRCCRSMASKKSWRPMPRQPVEQSARDSIVWSCNFAHGYLVSQFLSPQFNKRTDEYGGSRRTSQGTAGLRNHRRGSREP